MPFLVNGTLWTEEDEDRLYSVLNKLGIGKNFIGHGFGNIKMELTEEEGRLIFNVLKGFARNTTKEERLTGEKKL